MPLVGPAIGRRHPDRPHEQHAGPADRGEQRGEEALALQLGHRAQVDDVDFAIVLQFDEGQRFAVLRLRPDADEILRERLAHRHRRQQFLDAGGFQHLRIYAQPRQVIGVVAGGSFDQFQVGFVGHRYLHVWPGKSENNAPSAGTTDAWLDEDGRHVGGDGSAIAQAPERAAVVVLQVKGLTRAHRGECFVYSRHRSASFAKARRAAWGLRRAHALPSVPPSRNVRRANSCTSPFRSASATYRRSCLPTSSAILRMAVGERVTEGDSDSTIRRCVDSLYPTPRPVIGCAALVTARISSMSEAGHPPTFFEPVSECCS